MLNQAGTENLTIWLASNAVPVAVHAVAVTGLTGIYGGWIQNNHAADGATVIPDSGAIGDLGWRPKFPNLSVWRDPAYVEQVEIRPNAFDTNTLTEKLLGRSSISVETPTTAIVTLQDQTSTLLEQKTFLNMAGPSWHYSRPRR